MPKTWSIIHCRKCGFYARYNATELVPESAPQYRVELSHIEQEDGVTHLVTVEARAHHTLIAAKEQRAVEAGQ